MFLRKHIHGKLSLYIRGCGVDRRPARKTGDLVRQRRRTAHMSGEQGDHIPPFLIQHQHRGIRILILYPRSDKTHGDPRRTDKQECRTAPLAADQFRPVCRHRPEPFLRIFFRRIRLAYMIRLLQFSAQSPAKRSARPGKTEEDDLSVSSSAHFSVPAFSFMSSMKSSYHGVKKSVNVDILLCRNYHIFRCLQMFWKVV